MIRKGDTIPGICTVSIGAFALIYILNQPKMVIYGASVNGVLGPGFLPAVSSAMLVILGVFLILRGIRQNGTKDYFQMTPERKENFKTVSLVILFCALLLLAWKITKQFLICLFIYSLAINIVLKRGKRYTVIFAVIVTAFVFVLFYLGFSIRFRP